MPNSTYKSCYHLFILLPAKTFQKVSKYKDLYGKKPIVSVTYENERISIKNSLPYLKCVTSLLCGPRADLWPFM